jgi:hypothetical protein
MLRALLVALLAAGADVHAQSCTFRSTGSALGFAALDPSAAPTVTAFMDVGMRCLPPGTPAAWTFSGANGNAPLRLRHATQAAYIPYTVNATLVRSSGANQTWRITGTIVGASYQNALVGAYTDVLTATVTP